MLAVRTVGMMDRSCTLALGRGFGDLVCLFHRCRRRRLRAQSLEESVPEPVDGAPTTRAGYCGHWSLRQGV